MVSRSPSSFVRSTPLRTTTPTVKADTDATPAARTCGAVSLPVLISTECERCASTVSWSRRKDTRRARKAAPPAAPERRPVGRPSRGTLHHARHHPKGLSEGCWSPATSASSVRGPGAADRRPAPTLRSDRPVVLGNGGDGAPDAHRRRRRRRLRPARSRRRAWCSTTIAVASALNAAAARRVVPERLSRTWPRRSRTSVSPRPTSAGGRVAAVAALQITLANATRSFVCRSAQRSASRSK